MPKAVIEDINSVPEALREHYVQKDDYYVLNVEPVTSVKGKQVHYSLEDVGGLKNALQSERSKARELEKIKAAYGEHSPEAVAQALEELNSLRASGTDVESKAKALADSQIKQIVAKHQQELEKSGKVTNRYKSQLEKVLIHDAASAAIRAAGGDDNTVALLTPHMLNHLAVREVGENLVSEVIDPATKEARIGNASGAAMTIEQLAAEMKSSPIFGSAFPGTGRSGNGTNSTNRQRGGTPRKKSEFTSSQRSDFIEQHGAGAWIGLPD
jgi:hypothetical protein